eukprot:Pgem_evm1s1466
MSIVFDGCCTVPDPTDPTNSCTDESYARCLEGQDMNSTVNIFANVAQTFIGLIFAVLMNRGILVRTRFVWSGLLAVGSALLIATKFLNYQWYCYMVGIMMAIPISGINSFPFAIVGKYNKDDGDMEVGAQFGILNLFIVVPQIICTIVIGQLRDAYGDDGLGWALFAA